MSRECAVGVLVCDRLKTTLQTLDSIYHTEQNKSTYDLYIISNGSSDETVAGIKNWIAANFMAVKNLIVMPRFNIATAWNMFLMLTQEYKYRIKLDNDIVFHGTPMEQTRQASSLPSTGVAGGVNPGSVPVAGFVMGAGAKPRRKMPAIVHTNFVDHLVKYSNQYSTAITSLVTLDSGVNLAVHRNKLAKVKFNDTPYLKSGCSMITQECFDRLGYFDERLPRMVDVDYCLRAAKEGLKFGYDDVYWAYHIGTTHTDGDPTQNKQIAMNVLNNTPLEGKGHTRWEEVSKIVSRKAEKHLVVNLV